MMSSGAERRRVTWRGSRHRLRVQPPSCIEVQHAGASLELAARGLGGTLVTRALLDTLGYRDRLVAVPLDPPLHEIFAFIRRRNARLSPATRALMTLAEQHLADLARQKG
jgi:LysR family transcriptional regulator, cyn operon transcriptional activator